MNRILDLTGKIAVVTGGSRGIGREIAETFAAFGATVIIASRNFKECETVANIIIGNGGKAKAFKCDISNIEDIDYLMKSVLDNYDQLDILVNNAGVSVTKPSIDYTVEDWNKVFDINIKGLFFACQHVAKIMIGQGKGKIINISSIGGIRTFKRIAPYGASKAAVIHLTKSLASEWSRHGILVNGIAPGLISTDINKEEFANERLRQKMLQLIPLRREGNPSDIALMAVFLASEASDFITGQTISIDGGATAE